MAEPIRMEGLTLPVRDVARSVAFYHDTLEFPVQLRHGTTFALIRIGEGTIGLLSQAVPEAAPARVVLQKLAEEHNGQEVPRSCCA